ncbi:MAG: hypothetical protein K0U52_06320, partial [Gammaproteobacteria bacterium]|nr:hypothetical protein [Gammaproteobacteria bacterium]
IPLVTVRCIVDAAVGTCLPKIAEEHTGLTFKFALEYHLLCGQISEFRHLYPTCLIRLLSVHCRDKSLATVWLDEADLREGKLSNIKDLPMYVHWSGLYIGSEGLKSILIECFQKCGFLGKWTMCEPELNQLEYFLSECMKSKKHIGVLKTIIDEHPELGRLIKIFNLADQEQMHMLNIDQLECRDANIQRTQVRQRTVNRNAVQGLTEFGASQYNILPSRTALNKAAINGHLRVCHYFASMHAMYPNTLGFVQLVRVHMKYPAVQLSTFIPDSTVLFEHLNRYPDEEVVQYLSQPVYSLAKDVKQWKIKRAFVDELKLDLEDVDLLDLGSTIEYGDTICLSMEEIANNLAAQGDLQGVIDLWSKGYCMGVDGVVSAVTNGHTHIVEWFCSMQG